MTHSPIKAKLNACFLHEHNRYPLMYIDSEDMNKLRIDPLTGLEREIYGYPLYFDELKRVWPLPTGETKVEYD